MAKLNDTQVEVAVAKSYNAVLESVERAIGNNIGRNRDKITDKIKTDLAKTIAGLNVDREDLEADVLGV